MKKIVVIPTYNEKENLEAIVQANPLELSGARILRVRLEHPIVLADVNGLRVLTEEIRPDQDISKSIDIGVGHEHLPA